MKRPLWCTRCGHAWADHAKSYNAILRRMEPMHPEACHQYVMPSGPTRAVNRLVGAIDWLTAKVLSLTFGRKH